MLRACLLLVCLGGAVAAESAAERLARDAAAGRPLVAHVVVALCDNRSQGIVPVPAALGDGQDPRTNLYWGALYGVRTHLAKVGWRRVDAVLPARDGVLDQIVLRGQVACADGERTVHLVAEAWDGARIRDAIVRMLRCAAGHDAAVLEVGGLRLPTGGGAHLVAYVGHDGLMDVAVDPPPDPAPDAPARAAMALCCHSRRYFGPHLAAARAEPVLTTTGLMAPEAYVLDGALRAWFAAEGAPGTAEAAARAYDRFQRCGLGAARRLFGAR